jgi:RNA polymerase sigma-70 factor, ECF subfamily
MHAIARYKFLDYLQRTKVSFKEIPTEDAPELTATSEVAAAESGLDLERLMSGISCKVRRAIRYVKQGGLGVSGEAARCGMSESSVKAAARRGLKALALRIRQERRT